MMVYAMTSPYYMTGKVADSTKNVSVKKMVDQVVDWLVELTHESNPEAIIDGVKYEVEGLNVIISYRHRNPSFHSSISVQFFLVDEKYRGVDSGVPLHNLCNNWTKFDLLPITGLSEPIPSRATKEERRRRKRRLDREEDGKIAYKWATLNA